MRAKLGFAGLLLLAVAAEADGDVSASGGGAGTANFFVRDLVAVPSGPRRTLDVVLVCGAAPAMPPSGVMEVRAPPARGPVLMRTLVTDPAAMDALRRTARFQQSCTPVTAS